MESNSDFEILDEEKKITWSEYIYSLFTKIISIGKK